MDRKYWIGRKRSAMAMARQASTAEARLIHYELAGRYSIKAANIMVSPPPGKPPGYDGAAASLPLYAAPVTDPAVPTNAIAWSDPPKLREDDR